MRNCRWLPFTWLFLAAILRGVPPSRHYEIYSSVQESDADPEGVELELVVWEDSVDGTLTVYRPLTPANPIRLRGTARDQEISLSVSAGEEALEIRWKRSAARFVGEMTYRRNGQVIRTDALDLPRKKLKGSP